MPSVPRRERSGGVVDHRGQLLGPVIALEEEVEVEEVVGRERRSHVGFEELGGKPPDLFLDADRDQQGADRRRCVVNDRRGATGAVESVGTPVVVGADPDGQVGDPQSYRPAARTLRFDGCHVGSIGTIPAALEDRLPKAGSTPPYDAASVAPITFAHRGARAQHPENTIPAFRHALEHGARGLETDAWLSGDGEVVLVHDSWVRGARLGLVPRRIAVATATAAELSDLGVPALADLYRELGSDYELSIDLKDAGVGERIVEVAHASGAPGRLWLCSPSRGALRPLGELAPEARLVHSQSRNRLEQPLERHAAGLAESHIDAMNMHHSEWTPGLVALFHRFEIKAFAWDTQEVRHLHAMASIGIDAVYCDHVDRMVQTIDG